MWTALEEEKRKAEKMKSRGRIIKSIFLCVIYVSIGCIYIRETEKEKIPSQ